MAQKRILRTKEEKLAIIKEVLNGKSSHSWEKDGIDHSVVRGWIKKYKTEGEEGVELKQRPQNPLSRFAHLKNPALEETLLHKIELLKREILIKDAEIAHLKQQNARKEGDTLKK